MPNALNNPQTTQTSTIRINMTDFLHLPLVEVLKLLVRGSIGYPKKCFTDSDEDKKSKGLVQRYLDATRCDMFFANKLIFVEGMAEEILLPTFARYLGYDLANHHILIVNTGLRYYRDFLKMFDSTLENRINKRIACITDIDPMRDGSACYPFEYGIEEGHTYSHHGEEEITSYASHPNGGGISRRKGSQRFRTRRYHGKQRM